MVNHDDSHSILTYQYITPGVTYFIKRNTNQSISLCRQENNAIKGLPAISYNAYYIHYLLSRSLINLTNLLTVLGPGEICKQKRSSLID